MLRNVINRDYLRTEGSSLGLGGSPFQFRLTPEDVKALGGAIADGQSFNLALSPSDVTQSEELDNYLPGYLPDGGYRADMISPIFLVDKDVGEYRYYGSVNAFRLYHTETSYLAPIATIDPETSLGQYRVIQHGLGAVIPPMTASQSNFDVRAAAGRRVAGNLAMRREYKVINYARQTSTWNAAQRTTLTSDYYWNGGVNSDPIADLQTRILASNQDVTAIFMGLSAGFALVAHPLVRDYVKSMVGDAGMQGEVGKMLMGQRQLTTGSQLNLPGLPPIYIASARMRNETSGLNEEIIGGDVILISDKMGAGEFDGIRTFQTFRQRMESGTGWVNREFRVEQQGLLGVDMLVAGYSEADVVVANDAGGLIKSVIG